MLGHVDADYLELFELAGETGMRLAEVLAPQWHELDLDPDSPTIDIRYQLSRARRGRPARRVKLKSRRSARVLEITPRMAARLRAKKERSAHNGPRDYVFCNREGRPLDHRNVGGRVLARAVKKARLGAVRDINGEVVVPAPTFHALRHSHASRLIAEGWDIQEVSARLGHASIATTQEIYVHEFDAARRSPERRDRLARLYGGPMEASMEAVDDSRPQQIAAASTTEPRRLRQNSA